MVLKEGGLLSLCTGVPLPSMVEVQVLLKEGGLLSLYVCIGVPLSLMVLKECVVLCVSLV